MADELTIARSRRALLGGAVGGLAAFVANALGRPAATYAADGEHMIVGRDVHNGTSLTYLLNNTNNATVFGTQSTTGGIALSGVSNSNIGVIGVGQSGLATGVKGSGGSYGVFAEATTQFGTGLVGTSADGHGVNGYSGGSGNGVFAVAHNGTALRTIGRLAFERQSGTVSVAVGTKTKTASPPFGAWTLTVKSLILCTLETNQAGLYLKNVLKNVGANNFKITLSAAVSSGKYANVAYLIVENDPS
jgi:hypothetical protein